MMTAIRKRAGDFAAILVLVVIAGGVGGYILSNQRLRFPFIEEKPFQLQAAFSTAQAVTPGQGQTVRMAGVRIGDISAVKLRDGQAIITMDLDPEYKDLVHTDASALLRPKTGLKDMFIELDPGSTTEPLAKAGWTLPVRNTLPDVNPDEVYSALDADTRDYLKLLVNGAGEGLKGRGADLQEVFARFEPTNRDIARVTTAIETRRANLKRLVNSLQRLNTELATRGGDLSQLVTASATVFRAFASESSNISLAVRRFPSALRQTTSTLGRVQTFAEVLTPTADKLRPAVRSLNTANRAIQPFAREAAPILHNSIRPFVRGARPLVRDLKTPGRQLADATPDLTRSFVVLNKLFDLFSYNPNGREGPGVANRQEGYLFWIAWVTHQTVNVFNTGDAHGSFRPVTIGGPCGILAGQLAEDPTGIFSNMNLGAILGAGGACS
ncbi:MAG: phospholipid/cholesterol/gamma-HCH transport system substrate-binding protein [Solirubrobacteraceae bacterium]|jgi:phospholipid/cholesterol/gamma-HCH transport system substrate-binding protein|nr:phospholipid/cholesterol/gamma-HCH transport system substrate-binding protein [Solirubrobacteraceae bacterium]